MIQSPYEIIKDESLCSSSKPYAVVKKGTKKKFGCHATKAAAKKQLAALYANETDAVAQGVVIETQHLLERRSIRAAAVIEEAVVALSTPVTTYSNDGIVLAKVMDVPLYKLGMNFPASSGPVDFSFQHLAASVEASKDPMVPRPRIKLGHTDPRYNTVECPACKAGVNFNFEDDRIFDGTPSFGFVEDPKLTANGGVVVANLVDVPLWLAKIMPVAFASRSIEGWFGYTGPNEKEYDFVVTALSLLGVAFPGVLNLPDLPQMYGAEMPDYVQVYEAEAA